ncbi:MAG TPA: type II toxin-antitoxin system MqsA family antitoxin [Acidobacteriota bacterium]|nr:type II toxin-antitoxin system MqsA family antitoxin [Acidobacteriota bacterium]
MLARLERNSSRLWKMMRALREGRPRGEGSPRSRLPEEIDVRKVRERLGMSQRKFAQMFGFSIHSIRNWEQGKRRPEGPARALLTVIAKEPEAVVRSLSA